VTSTLGQSDDKKSSLWNQERQAYFSLIDSVTGEIGSRFGEANIALFQSISALQPSSPLFLDENAIKPLAELLRLQQDPLHAELLVGQSFLRKKLRLDYSFEKTTNLVFQFKDAFPSLYTL
jgi:hypothetical protein